MKTTVVEEAIPNRFACSSPEAQVLARRSDRWGHAGHLITFLTVTWITFARHGRAQMIAASVVALIAAIGTFACSEKSWRQALRIERDFRAQETGTAKS